MPDTFIDWSATPGRELMPGLTAWASTGASLQLVKSVLAPGCSFEPHTHLHEQFLAVLTGTFECIVGEQVIRCGAGGVFHFPANQAHGGRVIGLEPVAIIEAFHPPRKDYTPETRRADHDRPS
jgi:quercetin dioxygenase-like cupin family protein